MQFHEIYCRQSNIDKRDYVNESESCLGHQNNYMVRLRQLLIINKIRKEAIITDDRY